MVRFKTIIKQFDAQGEKTGWTYISIPASNAQKLKPGNKKTFRVKGKLDEFKIAGVALLPMGDGGFIMAINASMRKGIRKRKGASLTVELELDRKPITPPGEFLDCLADEPLALEFFNTLAKSHQNYFGNWVKSAKTQVTKDKRIAQSINALTKKYDFGIMLRALQQERKDLMG